MFRIVHFSDTPKERSKSELRSDMSETDFQLVCSIIDREKEFLNSVSQDIWKNPELAYEEFHAHDVLTDVLSSNGFLVEKHYLLPTAFKAEYSSKTGIMSVHILDKINGM
ncbi:peptidase M20 domain-containing protein 2 [Trichonephila inaurata madagascariensis]|uniref:Peptidase M20 domain-containing protein 2 n=1 Tax=Trichonephila inaurata madagascariensis TaxID=2747483 RepID=A0A8X7BPN5_9ARAC|nr:peptidase M20 domain-containing protein 2 [Trichonephila inaurata madagascariensis]